MSMKEIDNENATYQEGMYIQGTNKNEVVIEVSRKRKREHFISRTFVRLFL